VGTTFEILLPATEQAAEVSSPAIRPVPERGSESILVAEDEEAVRRLVHRVLTKHGYVVTVAASGINALEICEAEGHDIDLLLTDVIMPGMSGKDLAEAMRRNNEGIQVLFMSGYPGETLVSRGVFAEGESYLQKPFTSEQLLTAVRRMLDPIETELAEISELVATPGPDR
jgi:CheY-like chemotaxis protein